MLIYVSSGARPNDLKVLYHLGLKVASFHHELFDVASFQKCDLSARAQE